MSSMEQSFFQQFGFRTITDSVTNRKSLLAVHGIKILSNILIRHLPGLDHKWDNFLGLAKFNYNSYTILSMDSSGHFECVSGQNTKIYPSTEVTPEVVISHLHLSNLSSEVEKATCFP